MKTIPNCLNCWCLGFRLEWLQSLCLSNLQSDRKVSTKNFSRQGNRHIGSPAVDHTAMVCDTALNANSSTIFHSTEERYIDTGRESSDSSSHQKTELCSLFPFRTALTKAKCFRKSSKNYLGRMETNHTKAIYTSVLLQREFNFEFEDRLIFFKPTFF